MNSTKGRFVRLINMKLLATLLIAAAMSISGTAARAQTKDIVTWEFSSKKVSDGLYDVYLTARVKRPWHIYSQSSPEGGPLPTSITFSANPLLQLTGKPVEKGLLKEKYEEVFEVKVKYFEDSVQFVQRVKIKTKAKTNLSGTIEYMACNDEQCLPPASIPFTVNLF